MRRSRCGGQEGEDRIAPLAFPDFEIEVESILS